MTRRRLGGTRGLAEWLFLRGEDLDWRLEQQAPGLQMWNQADPLWKQRRKKTTYQPWSIFERRVARLNDDLAVEGRLAGGPGVAPEKIGQADALAKPWFRLDPLRQAVLKARILAKWQGKEDSR